MPQQQPQHLPIQTSPTNDVVSDASSGNATRTDTTASPTHNDAISSHTTDITNATDRQELGDAHGTEVVDTTTSDRATPPPEPEDVLATVDGTPLDVSLEPTSAIAEDDNNAICALMCMTEARIDLHESHALLTFGAMLQAIDEQFTHTHFDRDPQEELEWMFDEYTNGEVVVTYCMQCQGRDQLRVRWIDPHTEHARRDDELPALARRIARSIGGGTNLHLFDAMVPLWKKDLL